MGMLPTGATAEKEEGARGRFGGSRCGEAISQPEVERFHPFLLYKMLKEWDGSGTEALGFMAMHKARAFPFHPLLGHLHGPVLGWLRSSHSPGASGFALLTPVSH